jgi:oligoribonuclease NrnB/cAMP/cGMP phosphodiesterase (DHH superfamily)
MKKLNVYLDTSVINFLFAEDSPEKKKITEEFFDDYVAKGKFNAYISSVVIEEIERTKETEKRERLSNVILKYDLPVIGLTEEGVKLGQKYIEEKIIPEKKVDDARHLAIATINEIDVLVSWNFKHLANVNKERQVIAVNIREGYNYPLRLTTPLEVMD